ncbi:MSMEG_4193 family putative phosphomutase [Streptomyces sp. SID6673]|nr:MSMEG_4193 family putative phosphomutase [Streptomyces sp. SID11726]NEB25996.1 MSMEG_4193 family putative phosphomutase [Streptomyces sp. SID6673]
MTVILVRHGRSTANTSGVLAGRTPGVCLDDKGREQAAALIDRLGVCMGEIAAVARSPLDRCAQTVAPLMSVLDADADRDVPELVVEALAEVDYGDWTNRPIKELLSEPLWKTVQQHPSAAVFPGGEGLAAVQARAVAAIRDLDRVHAGEDGSGVWVACSHGDVIKAVIADAMGMHLDSFQRIVVEPASISVIRYGPTRPYVHTVNNTAVLSVPPPHRDKPASSDGSAEDTAGADAGEDAVVGGASGVDGRDRGDKAAATPLARG